MDLIGDLKRNEFGNMLFLIQLFKKISSFFAILCYTLSNEQQYHRRKIRESLEIKKTKMNKWRKVLNWVEGNLVKTNTWTPPFAKVTKEETNTKTWRQIRNGFISTLCFNYVWKRLSLTKWKYYKVFKID